MKNLFKKDVAINAILYILSKRNGSCDMHTINKILYFADQKHLSIYGRLITGDTYIAMNYGAVPSCIYDMFKAVRGDSYFSNKVQDLKQLFEFTNKYTIRQLRQANLDCLSESDIECIDSVLDELKGKNFAEITTMSHGIAWNSTQRDREMSVKDILREVGDTEEYVEYVSKKLKEDALILA